MPRNINISSDNYSKQQQDRIKRQMTEQSLARPIWDGIVIESNPRPRNHMDDVIDNLAYNIHADQDRKQYGDKIKIRSLPNFMDDFKEWTKDTEAVKEDVGLTLVNGVYE